MMLLAEMRGGFTQTKESALPRRERAEEEREGNSKVRS